MPAPSPLAIATQSVQRLVKEDGYYRKELAQQSERVEKLEADLSASESADGNAKFMLKQEQKALEETRAVFAPLHERIAEAVERLEERIATAESEGGAPADEVTKAEEALKLGREVQPPAA